MSDYGRNLQLTRLLNLLAYIAQHPKLTLMEIAHDLGMEPQDVKQELDVLHLSGVGKGPGEMIDLEHSWKAVTILDDQGLSKPLRLTPIEANSLILLLESFESMPAIVDRAAARSAAEKLRAAMGRHDIVPAQRPSNKESEQIASILVEAQELEQSANIRYYSASSDTLHDRTVFPITFFHLDGHTYMKAVEGGETKNFRLDRIRQATLEHAQGSQAQILPGAVDKASDQNPFGIAHTNTARLLIRKDSTWLAHYWSIELLEQDGDRGIEATMRYGSDDWLVRFCLHYGDKVSLLSPPELRDEVFRRARTALLALE